MSNERYTWIHYWYTRSNNIFIDNKWTNNLLYYDMLIKICIDTVISNEPTSVSTLGYDMITSSFSYVLIIGYPKLFHIVALLPSYKQLKIAFVLKLVIL